MMCGVSGAIDGTCRELTSMGEQEGKCVKRILGSGPRKDCIHDERI
jgi:hypothetical protein